MTRQHGSISVEVVLVAPVFLLLLGLVVMAGRLGEARIAVVHSAQQAARAASLAGDASGALAEAQDIATRNLEALGRSCSSLRVDVDTSRFAPGGDVSVTVACSVDLADVSFAGIPGTRTLQADAIEVIDRYRGLP